MEDNKNLNITSEGTIDVVLAEKEQKKVKRKKIIKVVAITTAVAAAIGTTAYVIWRCCKGEGNTELITELPKIELPKISPEIQALIDNRTGETLTAQSLGRQIGVSSREVNRRLIESGLAQRFGDSIYPTEAGKDLCAFIDKETRYGYCFRGIEWDECVANLIFSPEEVERAAKRAEEISKIVAEMSA